MRLKGKTSVVTGAGAGIGRAIAHAFALEGSNVVLADINSHAAKDTARLIAEAGGTAVAVHTDVADPASVEQLVKTTLRHFHFVDALVNNAAIQVNKKIEDTTFEEWNRQMAVNVGGMFLCCKYFLPHLRAARGSIVNMSSVNGTFVEPMCAGYCATKAEIGRASCRERV